MERARLIKKFAKIKEEQGIIAEAVDLMQEIVVSWGSELCSLVGKLASISIG